MNLIGKSILFLSANFFGYEVAIVKRLLELGAEVDFFNERPSDSILSKGIIRVANQLYQNKIKNYYQNILESTKDKNYDFFLLIKGETIPFFFLEKFKEFHPQTVKIFYSYDAVTEYSKFLNLYSYFDKNFTFEPKDAKQYQLHFRPLFFLNYYKNTNKNISKKYDLVFIGSAHTDRYLIGEKIKKICFEKNLKTFYYYYYYYAPSKIAFILKKIFDKNLKKFNIKTLSLKKLKHSEIESFYSQSRAVLDINKPFQEGLSMRTFESLASGNKLLTTNQDIKNYPFYDAENILILNRKNLEIDADLFKLNFKEIAPEILKMMSLDSWLECLFIENQDNYWKKFHPGFTK
jgi:hypothetical protein